MQISGIISFLARRGLFRLFNSGPAQPAGCPARAHYCFTVLS